MGKDLLLREVVFALEFWTDVSRTGWLFLRMERRLLQQQSLRAVWAAGEAHRKLGDAVEKGLLSSPLAWVWVPATRLGVGMVTRQTTASRR